MLESSHAVKAWLFSKKIVDDIFDDKNFNDDNADGDDDDSKHHTVNINDDNYDHIWWLKI